MDITKIDFKPILESARVSENGLAELLKVIQPYVINKATYYLGSRHDAEDIYQMVSLKLYNNLNNIRPESFLSYLKTMVTNACTDVLRSRHKTTEDNEEIHTVSLDAFEDYDIADMNSQQIDLTDEYRKQIIQEVISKLPEKQREVIILRYMDDLNIRQISEKLNIPESTIKSRLSVAYKGIQDEVLKIQDRDDIKLYSFSPVAFFLLLFRNSAENSSNIDYSLVNRTYKNIRSTVGSNAARTGIDSALENSIHSALSGNTAAANTARTAGHAAYVSAAATTAAKAGLPLIAKVVIGVLSGALLITGVYFGVDRLILNRNVRQSDVEGTDDEEITVESLQKPDGSYYSALEEDTTGIKPENVIGKENPIGLSFIGLGYVGIYEASLDCGSNYLDADAGEREADDLFSSACSFIRSPDFQTMISYHSIGSFEWDYAFRPNEDFSMLIGSDGITPSGYNKVIYCVYDPSVNKYRFEYYEAPEGGEMKTFEYQPNEKIYFDDNLANYLQFYFGSISADHFLYGISEFKADQNGRIVMASQEDSWTGDTIQCDFTYDDDGRIYEVTISGKSAEGPSIHGAIGKTIGNGTYRFIYNDEGLLEYVAHVRSDGKLELVTQYYYVKPDEDVPDVSWQYGK